MPISIQCPNPACGKIFITSVEIENRRVQCKQCGRTFIAAVRIDAEKSDVRSGSRSSRSDALPPFIGRFQIRSKLGAGAFGTVYRAYDPRLDREVALKVPNPGTLDSPKRVERFLREAKAAAGLRHPHIVPIFDAGKDGERYFIAASFIAGKKLADTIDETGTEFGRAARIIRELAEALAYAHEQGIVHRDVKPDNIMLDRDDRTHLMDFGLAARQDEDSKLTNDGAVMGTPSYMAPEQARGQQGDVKPAADQYSAGIVLYEMLCGKVPFEGPPAIVIHNQIHTDPDPPTKSRPDIPKDLETICLKAMSKRPEDRYANCEALANDLRRWQEGDPIAARQLSRIERFTRWIKKNKAVSILSGLAALLLLVGILVSTLFGIQARDEAGRADRESLAAKTALAQVQTEQRNTSDALIQVREEQRKIIAAQKKTGEALEESERNLSYSRLLLAEKEWDGAGSALQSGHLLDQIPEQFRNIEWRLAKRKYEGGLFSLDGHTQPVNRVAISSEANRIITLSYGDETARVWDATTGRHLFELKGHRKGVRDAAISHEGARIVTGSDDGTARIWDARTGENLLELKHTEAVKHISISSDGTRIVTTSALNGVRVWDGKTGASLLELKMPSSPMDAKAAISANGARILTQSDSIDVWDAKTGERLFGYMGMGGAAAISSDGTWIVDASGNTEIAPRVLDVKTGKALFELKGIGGNSEVAISRDDTRIVTNSSDHAARIWDAKTGQNILVLKGHTDAVNSVAISSDGMRIVTGSDDKTAKVWDAKAGQTPLELPDTNQSGVAVSKDGTRIVTSSLDSTARVWDANSGARLLELKGHTGPLNCVAMSADGRRIVTGSDDQTARVWDAKTGESLLELKPANTDRRPAIIMLSPALASPFHQWYIPPCVGSVAISADGRRIVTGSDDQTARVWDGNTGENLLELKGSEAKISSDGTRIVTLGESSAQVWDAKTGKSLLEFHEGKGRGFGRTAISIDGKRIVTGAEDARVWDAKTGENLLELKGNGVGMFAVAIGADGERIFTGSHDGTVRIWDSKTGQSLLELKGDTGLVNGVAIGADGNCLVTLSKGRVRIWDARPLPKPDDPLSETDVLRRKWIERLRSK